MWHIYVLKYSMNTLSDTLKDVVFNMAKQTVANQQKKKNLLLAPIKWIGSNIALPFLPIVVKMLVNWFSKSEIDITDPNDLLYYNFFICILLLGLLKKRDTIFSCIVTYVVGFICVADILFIGFISTGQQNPETIQAFAISVAIICASFGSIYVLIQARLNFEKGSENNG